MPSRLHLFQAYGVELEYMIVDRSTLDVKPIADQLLKAVNGRISSEYNNGRISWSNELVSHVIELKCTDPDADLATLGQAFYENVQEINAILKKFEAKLMPTAAHPWMDPAREAVIWPHEQNDIYLKYNEMFNCQGHGWSNLQSTHINLPFYDDEEFSKLHTAIRILLPILPALTASSPILDGHPTGYLDRRLKYYMHNQKRIPSISGKVIPERIFSKRMYHKKIYDRIAADILPFDPTGILDPIWVNSRGAIARFDRGAIEIRILDIQESPRMDLAVVRLIVTILKMLVSGTVSSFEQQEKPETDALYELFQQVIRSGMDVQVDSRDHLQSLGLKGEIASLREIWQSLLVKAMDFAPEEMRDIEPEINLIMKQNTLSQRILANANEIYSPENLRLLYNELCDSLDRNESFQIFDRS